ncbi:MAG: alkaline shock response membrane anchor protein AmaP [Tepidiformaceae bacterium]
MSILSRLFLAIYSVLFIALCAGLALLLWNDSEMIDLALGDLNFQAFFVPGAENAQKWAFSALMFAFCLLGFVTLILAFSRESQSGGRLKLRQADGGSVEIDAHTLEAMLRDDLQQIPEVRQADAKVRVDGAAVSTALNLVVEPSTNIAYVTDEASRVTARTLREQIGVENVRRPAVRISYDEISARPVQAGRMRPQMPPAPSDTTPLAETERHAPAAPPRQPLFPTAAPTAAPDAWATEERPETPAWEPAGPTLEWRESDESPVIDAVSDSGERRDTNG